MNHTLKRTLSLITASAVLWTVTALPTHAALKHRYTFNDSNVQDSVGTAHGTIVDPGATTASFRFDGQLDFSGNGGNASNNVTEDAYLDLPNLIVENAANSGVSGAVSFEWWFTISQVRTWQRIGDFSGPLPSGLPSENLTNDGNVQAMFMSPSADRNNGTATAVNQGIEISADAVGAGAVLGQINTVRPGIAAGVQRHVVAVYDKNNTSGGANPGGTMAVYLDGVNIVGASATGTSAIPVTFNLNDMNDEDNWLGRSNWGGDQVFDGTFNEFNIYDHPLTQAEVTASFTAGPVAVPLPVLLVNTVTGAAAIKNTTTVPITIDYYEITSALGRLNGANGAWNSLSDQNFDAGRPADFNNSGGAVDAGDLTTWKGAAIAATNAGGDADADGDTDGRDFLIWQRQLGTSAGVGESWDEAGGNSDNLLAELFLNGATTMAPNQQISLGSPFRVGGAQDLVFGFALKGGGVVPIPVQYVTTGPATGVPEPAAAALAAVLSLSAYAGLRRRRR